ncbi:MAG TPA: LptA/OstA family protein [Steroidobacteraceae bacterium]|nr:LptA/OstA family protein [Steroidobacteraceae bacterium]
MAASFPSDLLRAALAIAALAVSTAAGAQLADPDAPISLDAASSDFDYRNNVLVFRKVRITQGDVSVAADEATATGLNFENSRWNFRGDVHIKVPNGSLDSESAAVRFEDNQIANALIVGEPATFEQRQIEKDQLARGRAATIEYDISKGTVRLSGEAWLSDGSSEIRGETLVYNIGEERVLANPGEQDDRGVSITINPRGRDGGAERPPPAPEPGS